MLDRRRMLTAVRLWPFWPVMDWPSRLFLRCHRHAAKFARRVLPDPNIGIGARSLAMERPSLGVGAGEMALNHVIWLPRLIIG
jgi:hypothetical protein